MSIAQPGLQNVNNSNFNDIEMSQERSKCMLILCAYMLGIFRPAHIQYYKPINIPGSSLSSQRWINNYNIPLTVWFDITSLQRHDHLIES